MPKNRTCLLIVLSLARRGISGDAGNRGRSEREQPRFNKKKQTRLRDNNNGEHIMGLPLREAREVFERDYLIAQISRFSGNISRTAEFVGMERSALHRKLKALGVG